LVLDVLQGKLKTGAVSAWCRNSCMGLYWRCKNIADEEDCLFELGIIDGDKSSSRIGTKSR